MKLTCRELLNWSKFLNWSEVAEVVEEMAQPVEPMATSTSNGFTSPKFESNGVSWKGNPYFNDGVATNAPATTEPVEAPPVFEEREPVSIILPTPGGGEFTQIPNGNAVTSFAPEQVQPVTPFQMGLSEAAAQQAVHHIEYGKSLSRRGASFAARQEFFSALRVIAQANDASTGGVDFTNALTDGIRALKEAEDFVVSSSEVGGVIDVSGTIEAHKTKILTKGQVKNISSLAAMQEYYSFAQQQFDFAGGRNVVTAEAFHCLGKLHTVMANNKKTMPGNLDVAKAIVFHKSSLLSNPSNPASANELGVLMAKTGQLNQATELFKQSLIAQASPQAWNNLAKTHHRLGETQMAQLAETEFAIAAKSPAVTIASAGIQWVPNGQFNAMAPMEFEPRVASNRSPAPRCSSSQF